MRVEPSLEFGLDTERHSQRRRSSVQEVILTLGHEIQRVPDLVVNEAKKVVFNYIKKLYLKIIPKQFRLLLLIIYNGFRLESP